MIAMAVKRSQCLLFCLLLLCAVLAVLPAGKAETGSAGRNITSLDDLAGCEVAVQTGMICDVLAQQHHHHR